MTAQRPLARVTRIIARLNIGGPAIQAITLTEELRQHGFETRLVRGTEDPAEGNMDYLAEAIGVKPTLVPTMRRDPGFGDFRAVGTLVRLLRSDRPVVVHTHAAKGGTLGRIATVIAYPRRRNRPVVIHTYHGHSLTGYFSGRTAGFYRLVERLLAPVTDKLIAVSGEVRDDLIGLGVAPPEKFTVIPLGFELDPFTSDTDRLARRSRLRETWGIAEEELVVTLIARLVPIKRVDRFLEAAAEVSAHVNVRFVIVGDGELKDDLRYSPPALKLGDGPGVGGVPSRHSRCLLCQRPDRLDV